MAKYQSVNVKISNSQLNSLEWTTKNDTKATLRLSQSTIVFNETNFQHNSSLNDRQVSSFYKAFGINLLMWNYWKQISW